MWIKSLKLNNIRSFEKAELVFSRGINVLVGPNNSGKSTILLPLLGLQEGLPQLTPQDARRGQVNATAEISFGDYDERILKKKYEKVWHQYRPQNNDFPLFGTVNSSSQPEGVAKSPNREPGNFIYPFVSKRKVTELGEQVTDGTVETVPSTFTNLNAKIDRLMNPEFLPAHKLYMRACDEILGFRVTTAATNHGKRAVYTVHNMDNIPLLAMGEGVMNILGLVVHLAMAKNRLFLIEEPENDVHPKALKALLDLVGEKASTNQFIVTTHSNIVLKRLGSFPEAKVFSVEYTFIERMPTSTVTEIGTSADERRTILSDLGYELHDVDMWDAWLLLEESSAEKIIREYLVPWFTPSLEGRLRTYSAHSLSEVAPRFRDFNDLFVFLNLAQVYRNRAWVVIDGGEAESEIFSTLRSTYCQAGWLESRFRQLSHHDFESYYPNQFASAANAIRETKDKRARRDAKKKLLETVEEWIAADTVRAREAFALSAAELIDVLKSIEADLNNQITNKQIQLIAGKPGSG